MVEQIGLPRLQLHYSYCGRETKENDRIECVERHGSDGMALRGGDGEELWNGSRVVDRLNEYRDRSAVKKAFARHTEIRFLSNT